MYEDKQTNLSKIWCDKNDVALTVLIVIAEVLEIAIRPLFDQLLNDTIKPGKLKISFPKQKFEIFNFVGNQQENTAELT